MYTYAINLYITVQISISSSYETINKITRLPSTLNIYNIYKHSNIYCSHVSEFILYLYILCKIRIYTFVTIYNDLFKIFHYLQSYLSKIYLIKNKI